MKIRLYIDEDSMDQALVQALRARGVDVTTALEEGMIAKNDHLHLDYAARYGRALYSFYRGDFFHLHTISDTNQITCRHHTVAAAKLFCRRTNAQVTQIDRNKIR